MVWCGVVRGQVAVEGILDEEVQVYAVELLSKRPAQIEQFCREVQQAQNATADATAGAAIPAGSAAANDSESFEHRCLRAKEHNCGICQDNFAIDGKVADSPARINASLAGGTSMCEHEYCTSCWDTLAARAVPSATGPRGKRPLFPSKSSFLVLVPSLSGQLGVFLSAMKTQSETSSLFSVRRDPLPCVPREREGISRPAAIPNQPAETAASCCCC
eukprot:COSAG06_NODE_3841_length_4845_cov_99.594817_4_plen_217_part_00